jgi:uncharacterized protein (DUF305 family)
MRVRVLAAVAMAAASVLVLGGCGSDAPTSSPLPGPEASTLGAFNQADVDFAQDMIPHHQQALIMSDMALQAASTDELRALAQRIKDAQSPEIEQMTGWLDDWGQVVPDLEALGHMMMGHGDDDASNDMPGMMTVKQMRQLNQLMVDSDLAFDQMWVEMMILHHEGAIEMAQKQQADGQNEDAVALAEAIEEAQAAEIAEMEQLLDDWSAQG